MTTRVTVTGTGTLPVEPGRAGAGALVQYGDLAFQFDAGQRRHCGSSRPVVTRPN